MDFLKKYKKYIILSLAIVVALAISMQKTTQLLNRDALVYLGILCGMIVLLIGRVFPDYIVSMSALAALATFGTLSGGSEMFSFTALFAPFTQSTFWLILFAFAINTAVSSTGLIKKLLPYIYRMFPSSYCGRLLFLTVSGTLLSPFIPSTNAKAALLTPIAENSAQSLGFEKGSRGSAGLFCALLIPATVTAQAFFSGSGTVPIVLGIIGETDSASWMSWFSFTFLWLIVVTVLSFIVINIMYKAENNGMAASKEEETDSHFTKEQIIAGITLLVTLLMWMTQSFHGISYVLVAFLSFVVLAFTGIFKSEFISKLPWGMLLFIGSLLSMASLMTKLGIDSWLVEILSPFIMPFASDVFVFIAFSCVITYVARYVIISQSTCMAVMYLLLIPFAREIGITSVVLVFVVSASSNVWNLEFHNTAYLSAMGSGGDRMVYYKDVRPMSYAFMVVNIIACLASVPLWYALGLIA